MKELSIEDKAKRYDEAYKVAKNIHIFSSDLAEIKRMEEIFPELKEESEGERIRKKICKILWDNVPYEEAQEYITWLEKQGEQKLADLKTKAGNWYVCDIEVMNENMITAFHRGEIYYCPKDGYLDVGGALFEVGCLDVFRLATEKEIPQPKQNPAWSEEDERILNTVIHNLRYPGVNYYKKPIEEEVKWLKSLKDRVQPQPKQEWNKEDERILKEMIKIFGLENFEGYNIGENNEDALKFLKSLKERYTWKPSERQKEALLWCVVHLGGADKQTLGELLEALNKL